MKYLSSRWTRDESVNGRCRSTVHALALVAALLSLANSVEASDALARKYACAACHQAQQKIVGPAWKDVAAKYGDGSVSPAQLVASIRKGSSGKWGPMAMPPQGQVPDADLQTLAAWILGGGQ
jgi:cytochrome c